MERMGNYGLIPSILGTVILIIVYCLAGYFESGSLMGAAFAVVMGLIASIVCLVGLIPFGGPIIYTLLIWPWLSNALTAMQPAVFIPMTQFLIFIGTTIFSIIYCIMTSLIVLAVVFGGGVGGDIVDGSQTAGLKSCIQQQTTLTFLCQISSAGQSSKPTAPSFCSFYKENAMERRLNG